MARKTFFVLLGILLIAICAAWFLTPLSDAILANFQDEQGGVRGGAGEAPSAAFDTLNTALNALNTLFGAIGLFLTAKGLSLRQPK